MTLMNKGEELLGHSLHPAIVNVPLGAWTVSNVCDTMALATEDDTYDDSARVSMAVGLVGAAGAALTGLHDYSYIPRTREPSHTIATRHALGNAVVGVLFATSYIMRVREYGAGQRTSLTARLLAYAGGGLMAYTGWLGGKLVQEQGESVKPIIRQQEEQMRRERSTMPSHAGDGHSARAPMPMR
jgi:uncharacterized membrane protein